MFKHEITAMNPKWSYEVVKNVQENIWLLLNRKQYYFKQEL